MSDTSKNYFYTLKDLKTRFTYHPPMGQSQILLYKEVRDRIYNVALFLAEQMPDCRERSLAFTKLEEACMHANSGIARHHVTGSMEEENDE